MSGSIPTGSRTGICSAFQGFRHGSGRAMFRTQAPSRHALGAVFNEVRESASSYEVSTGDDEAVFRIPQSGILQGEEMIRVSSTKRAISTYNTPSGNTHIQNAEAF